MRHFLSLLLASLVGAWIALVSVTSLHAQTTDPTFPVNGTHDKALVATVLEHATLHLDAETTLEDGTVILHRGRIVAAGPSATTSFDGPAMRLDEDALRGDLTQRLPVRAAGHAEAHRTRRAVPGKSNDADVVAKVLSSKLSTYF